MKIDPTSATWLNILTHLEGRAAELRSKLEANISWDETLAARAALREIKIIFALAHPEEPPLVDQDFEIPS